MTKKSATLSPKIWLSAPHIGTREMQFVKDAFDTNWIAPLGPHVDGFEEALQEFTGVNHAAVVVSGTAALHLALILLEVKRGDNVICQTMTFSASANPIAYQGATPVFIDSETDTWNMSPWFLKQAVKKGKRISAKKPKAIIAVDLYGMPAKMDEILDVGSRYDIPVIEDAAEALGSHINGRMCGSFGQFGILSFNGNKIITTSGGGALLSDDAGLIEKARFLATQARDNAPHYQHSRIGYNYRMSNVLAAIGRGQMEVIGERVAARRRNFERYKEYFKEVNLRGFSVEFQPEPEGYFSNRWLTSIIIDPDKNGGVTREYVQSVLNSYNIESRPLWKPMHLQPVFEGAPFYGDGTSERIFRNGLCLPSGSNMGEAEYERVFTALDTIFH
jgi:dTDP-4-amino-4,6-dideoxygalactose transaminase